MANSAGVRQDKVRFIVADLEETLGTFVFDPTDATNGGPNNGTLVSSLRLPARAESRLMATDADVISNSEALDGYAGEVASTRGGMGMGGTLVTEVRSNAVANVFPTHVKQLLASGFQATSYTGGTFTLVLDPSTKALAAWTYPETGAVKNPGAMSIAEVLIDNNTADEWTGVRGAVLATKINLPTNGMVTYESGITGLVQNDVILDVATVDLSGFGGEPADQGNIPAVVKAATVAITYYDDDTYASPKTITPDMIRDLSIDLAPNIIRVEDPTATNGYTISPVFYDGAIGVNWTWADSSGYGGSPAVTSGAIMAGMKSQRGFISIAVTLTLLDTTTDQTIKFSAPCVQYDAERANASGARAFQFTGKAVRRNRGDNTSPFTVTYVHGNT
tara:strand:+ start:719 stop:1888 length:1170 start_codon:yes stop_codon:yes gene_type:complete